MKAWYISIVVTSLLASNGQANAQQAKVTLRGQIVDAETDLPVAARLYIESSDGKWFFAESSDPKGTALRYNVDRAQERGGPYHVVGSPFRSCTSAR